MDQLPRDVERAIDEIQRRLGRIEEKLGIGAEAAKGEGEWLPSVPSEAQVDEAGAPVDAPPLNSSPVLPPIATMRAAERPAPTPDSTATPVSAAAPASTSTPPAVPTPIAPPTHPVVGVTPVDRLEELARKRAAAMAARQEGVMAPPPMFTRRAGAEGPAPIPSQKVDLAGPARAAMKRVEESFTLEKLVGGRLAAYVGALFLVIGLVLGVTYGIKQGWFTFPPALRCAAVGLCGIGLIGAGMYFRKKLGATGNAVTSGLAAAGIGAMYGAALAAWGMYELYPAAVAFTLLAGISAAGVGLGLMWGSLSLGVLALLGAYLNPIFLHNEHGHPMVLPVYLGVLLAMGLTLAARRPRPFRWLRTVAWWGTVLLGSAWVLETGLENPLTALGFLAVVWGMVHGELVVATGGFAGPRADEEDACDGRAVPAAAVAVGAGARGKALAAREMRTSFATTVWAVGAGIIVAYFARAHVFVEGWHVAAGGFAGTFALALVLAGHLRVFRDVPRTERERLGVALWAESGALLITTVALGVSDWLQVVAWLAMGVAAVGAGRWARARSLDVYGIVVLLIAVGRLVAYESWQWLATRHEMFGIVFTWWTLLMAIGAAAWAGAAWLMDRPSEGQAGPSAKRRTAVHGAMGVGIALLFAGMMFQGAWIEMVIALGGAWALVAMGLGKWRDSTLLRVYGVIVLGMSTLVGSLAQLSALSDVLGPDAAAHWRISVGGVVVTSLSAAVVWLGVVWGISAWAMRGVLDGKRTGESWGTVGGVIGAMVLMLAMATRGTSWGGVSLVWAGIGAAYVVAHAFTRRLALDVIGLVVMWVATLAWMLVYVMDHAWLEERYGAFAHPGLWIGVGIAGAMLGAGAWLRGGGVGADGTRRGTWIEGAVAALAVAGALLLGCTSLEVSRSAGMLLPADAHAQAAALTVWWGVCSAVLLTLGFVRGVPIVRHLGLGLLGIAAVKAVLWDLAGVELGWRVVSFLGLGVLMMGVALAYAKLAGRLEGRQREKVG